MASIIAHSSKPGALLFSGPHTLRLNRDGREDPKGKGKRENLSIQLSYDDGKTWPKLKTLDSGPSAYSDLAVLPDGSVLCLYESKNDLRCARFNLEWIAVP